MNGKQILKKMETEGWILVRTSGSHHLMSKGNKTVPVPVHGTKDIGKGLVARIEKQSGVKLK